MSYFGIDVKQFLDDYFKQHDEELMERMEEVIGENEDAMEISALADWVFRNYMAEAFAQAVEKNNEQIYNDVKEMMTALKEEISGKSHQLPSISKNQYSEKLRNLNTFAAPNTAAVPQSGHTQLPAGIYPQSLSSAPKTEMISQSAIEQHEKERQPSVNESGKLHGLSGLSADSGNLKQSGFSPPSGGLAGRLQFPETGSGKLQNPLTGNISGSGRLQSSAPQPHHETIRLPQRAESAGESSPNTTQPAQLSTAADLSKPPSPFNETASGSLSGHMPGNYGNRPAGIISARTGQIQYSGGSNSGSLNSGFGTDSSSLSKKFAFAINEERNSEPTSIIEEIEEEKPDREVPIEYDDDL